MANSFSKNIDIFFEDVVVGWEAQNIASKNVGMFNPGANRLALGGQTFYRPVPLMSEVVSGRDVSSAWKDLTELTVPSTLTESHIQNVPIQMTGVDLNNEHIMKSKVTMAINQLSNKVDTLIMDAIATKGTLAVVNTGNIDSYDDAAVAEAVMLENQCTMGDRVMLLAPRMASNLAGNLAGRQTFSGAVQSAYERSQLPNIGGFSTFRTDYGPITTGTTGSGYLINGANQDYTPVSNSGGLPVDNRTQTLTVDTGANATNGSVFVIAGCHAVGGINKKSTGQLRTFRLLSGAGTTTWTISPPIIPADGSDASQKAYANVDTTPADNAAITFLNIATKATSVFYEKSAIELVHSEFDLDPFRAAGKEVRTATTSGGVSIALLADTDVGTLKASHRMFVWANCEVLNPEMAGIMLEGQV